MTDLINREALLKELLFDPIGRMLIKRYNLDGFIKAQPTVEAVPVIRCEKCTYKRIENFTWVCPFGLPAGASFYCGYGAREERKEE